MFRNAGLLYRCFDHFGSLQGWGTKKECVKFVDSNEKLIDFQEIGPLISNTSYKFRVLEYVVFW